MAQLTVTLALLIPCLLIGVAPATAGDVPAEWLHFGGRPADVDWNAQWIWTPDTEASPRNFHLCARRDFDLPDAGGDYRLHVTADSRYRLYVNGEWIGDGPARSFYWAQQFDTYDAAGLLRPGHNTIAVLVSHYGEGTFQYNPSGQAGLLVQLERRQGDAWKCVLTTDKGWSIRRHDGYLRPTMRVSCQMPFEENVDARLMPLDWMKPEGTLPDAKPAKEIGPVGTEPWTTLVGRTVPFLTREPIVPVRLFKAQLVEYPDLHAGFTTRPYLLPGYFGQTPRELRGFAATIIESPIEQRIAFAHNCSRFELPLVNGVRCEPDQPVPLHKGANLCVIALHPHGHHEFDRSYCAFVTPARRQTAPVKLVGVFQNQSPWTIFGPFDNHHDVHRRAVEAKTVDDLAPFEDKARPVQPAHLLPHGSAWNESTSARPVPGEVRMDNIDGLFGAPASVATIYPSEAGHPELWFDFGRELVGQIELDVEAPAGTVLTFNFIEEIEEGKRVHYTGDNFAGFRYITAEGRNRFTSFLRRGYRYAKLIVSEAGGPVQLRSLRTIFSTHPAVETGSFACSDRMLTDIWHIGRHTLRCCSEDTYTDCPAYEQTYWVGDGRNEAMIDYAAYGNLALSRRCAELPALSLFRQPITESQVPSSWENLLTAWSLLWVQMVEEHYQFSGDRAYLEGIYPAVAKMLRNIRDKLTDERGLLSIQAWNMFDWAGQDSGHKVVTHNQMFLVEALARAAAMAEVLHRSDDVAEWTDYRDKLIAAINEHLWSDTKNAYIDSIHNDGKPSTVVSQQTNSLALLYGVAPADRAAKIRNVPDAPPEGMVTVGSPFALFYILDALVRDGRHAEALAIIRKRWSEMVERGATTFWETFPGYEKEFWTRSYCHAWSAAPTYFLSRYQLGAWWDEPGYKRARIAPVPLDLTWARGAVPTPHGPIEVSWTKSPNRFTLEVALPGPVAAIVELPVDAATFTTTEPAMKNANGRWQLELPPGARRTITAAK